MKRIAIIPARSGSKGLKDKNIIDLCGKPLIAYSIEAALNSGLFSDVIVSTDSEHYAGIAAESGAEVIIRGEELSGDEATTFMVLEDLLLHQVDYSIDYFVLLQPTSPLRNSRHIKEAVSLLDSKIKDYDFLVSVTESGYPKVLVNSIGEDGSMRNFDADYANYRRQNYKEYTPNGAIFIAKPCEYLAQRHFYGARSLAYRMSDIDSVDIDGPLDLELARIIMDRHL